MKYLLILLFALPLFGQITEQEKADLSAWIEAMPEDPMDLEFSEFVPVFNWPATVELGSLLFTDASLSVFGQTSCEASCHVIENNLSPQGPQIGVGGTWIDGKRQLLDFFPTDLVVDAPPINSPSAENLVYSELALHDGSHTPFSQISQNAGSWVHQINWKACENNPVYEHYFKLCFGDVEFTEAHFQQAILTFEEFHISNMAPLHKWLRGEPIRRENLMRKGLSLFQEKECNSCHYGPALNGDGIEFGLPVYKDGTDVSFLKTDSVRVRSLMNLDSFEQLGWCGDYESLYYFTAKHAENEGIDLDRQELRLVVKWMRKFLNE